MSKEKDFFDSQICSLQNFTAIYQYLKQNATVFDADALLRAEYMLIVSTFDNYLHNIVRKQLHNAFFSSQPLPSDFCLPLNIYRVIKNEPNITDQKKFMDAAIRQNLEKDSFQSPRSVEYALNLIGIKHIWKNASVTMGFTPEDVRKQLALIIKRRNQIAHEADIEYNTVQLRYIDATMINNCRTFLKGLVSSIDSQII